MAYTLVAMYFINQFRKDAHKLFKVDPEASVGFGISAATAVTMGKYLITINIKIVDLIWSYLSPYLSSMENWKTSQNLKDAVVMKLFAVKFVVNYYPFFYIAFIQEQIEGCGSEETTACIDLLSENLLIFFFTSMATVIGTIAFTIAFSVWSIYKEIRQVRPGSPAYTYIQAQAKFAMYEGDTDDFMVLVVHLGFVLMFSVVLPVQAFLAFAVGMICKQLMAYRMTSVLVRADPKGQEGIGAWFEIIKAISYIGVVCNIGIAVVEMYPLREFDPIHKLIIFVAAQNIAGLTVVMIQGAFGEADIPTLTVEEAQDELLDDVFGATKEALKVRETHAIDLWQNVAGN